MYSLKPKQVEFDETWKSLKPTVIDILNMKTISTMEWNHKFSDVYDICVSVPEPLSERLYVQLRACIREHVLDQKEMIKTVDLDNLLQEYYRNWQVFHKGAIYIHLLFGYLNKQFVTQKKFNEMEHFQQYSGFLQIPNVKEVGYLALEIWRNDLVAEILTNLIDLVLFEIRKDRKGSSPENPEVISGVIKSFVQMEECDLGGSFSTGNEQKSRTREPSAEFYQSTFEKGFLEDTKMYYSSLAQQMLSEMTCSEYMEAVIELLEKEESRAKKYLHETSVKKVIELCQNVMIKAHKDKLHSVCHDLITNEKVKDLRNMYRLLKPIHAGLSVMVKEFEDYVKQCGLESIAKLTGDNVPQQFVENILRVYNKFNNMKSSVFMDDGEFSSGLDKALQGVVNAKEPGSNVPKASERLARYTDSLLKKTAKGLSESDMDEKLSNAIVIFRYIEDKDIFQKFYSKMLANRLIANSSISMDAEETMINKLKQACGYEFTSKLSRMFLDIGLSHDLSAKFEVHLNELIANKDVTWKSFVPTQTLILQAGSWPLHAPQIATNSFNTTLAQELEHFSLPKIVQPCVNEFELYYGIKHNGRKLTWLWNMSQGDVRLCYLDKPYVITMYVYQMAVVLCFDRRDSMTVKDISEAIGITGDYLLKTIRTIMDASVLLCDDAVVTMSSTLRLNMSMTSRRIKFRLQMPQMNKTVEKEHEAVANTVSQDRKYYMECAIVRIMKTRKVLKHNALVAEIMDQTKGRFTPDIPFIKKSIEDLIEKMYIQRTDQNDEYQYLA